MFGQLQLKTIQVEVFLEDYMIRAKIQPRGAMLVFLNDKQWPFLPLSDAEIFPLAAERQVNSIKQPSVVINKKYLKFICLTDPEESKDEQLLASKRAVAFYTGAFVVQGQLHVNQDARDQDLLDETKEYFAMSEASVYPIRKVSTSPTRHVPLLYLSRPLVQAYHTIVKKD
jgi:hypothetical protein